LKNLEFGLQNLFAVRNAYFPLDNNKLRHLCKTMNFETVSELKIHFSKVINQNSELFRKYF
jgi:hypothetical protein